MNLFFKNMHEQISSFQKTLSNCKLHKMQSYSIVKQLIEKEDIELAKLRKFVNEIKIYIVFMGTMSAGKSTFINSLIGSQLLPSRTQECTKQFLFISHGEYLKINNQNYDSLEQAEKRLLEMQSDQSFDSIYIETPSIFHKELPKDLMTRIIFVDTPGIKTGEEKLYNPLGKLDKLIIDKNMIINVWVSDYSHFDSEKNRIFKLFKEIKSKLNIEVSQKQENKKQNSEFFDKFLFVLNKMDNRSIIQDVSFDEITKEICQIVGDEHFIYKISSTKALNYRIMNYGEERAQLKLINTVFIDKQDDEQFQNLKDSQEFCENKIKKNQMLIKTQDYQLFYDQLMNKIKGKLNQEFKGISYQLVATYDVYLQLILNSGTYRHNTSQETKEKAVVIIKLIIDLVIEFEKKVQKYQQEYIEQLKGVIKDISDNFTAGESVLPKLQKVFAETSQLQINLINTINDLNLEQKNSIHSKINSYEIEKEFKQQLYDSCNLLNGFSEEEENIIKIVSEKQYGQAIKHVFGLDVIQILKISHGFDNLYQAGCSLILQNHQLLQFIFKESGVLMIGLTLQASVQIFLLQTDSLLLELRRKNIFLAHLDQFQEAVKNNITETCTKYINNNQFVFQGLTELFQNFIN